MKPIRTEMLPGDVIAIGDVRVLVEKKGGRRVRLAIHAPAGVHVVKLASTETDEATFDPAFDIILPKTQL